MIELGELSLTFFELNKLSELFKVPFTGFLQSVNNDEILDEDFEYYRERIVKIQKFSSFAETLRLAEIEHIIETTESLLKLLGEI